jgi:enoyl-CoA hydratase
MATDQPDPTRTQQLDPGFEITELATSVLLVRLNRPTERNPLSIAILQALQAELSKWFASDRIKTIIFTGTANVFASGANIRELVTLDSRTAREFAELGQKLLNDIAATRQTTIAAINGYCIGGGLDLALACDLRIASTNAKFAHPGARLGIITGWGGTQRLPRLIGRTRAFEMFLTTRTLRADEALLSGLVDLVADPVVAEALRLASPAS